MNQVLLNTNLSKNLLLSELNMPLRCGCQQQRKKNFPFFFFLNAIFYAGKFPEVPYRRMIYILWKIYDVSLYGTVPTISRRTNVKLCFSWMTSTKFQKSWPTVIPLEVACSVSWVNKCQIWLADQSNSIQCVAYNSSAFNVDLTSSTININLWMTRKSLYMVSNQQSYFSKHPFVQVTLEFVINVYTLFLLKYLEHIANQHQSTFHSKYARML